MEFTPQRWVDVCDALDLDPAATLSINVSEGWLRIVHADQAATSVPLVDVQPESEDEQGE